MKLSDITADFADHCTVERGHTPTTMKSWRNILRQFSRFVAEQTQEPSLSDLTPGLMKKYLYHLSKRDLRPRTIRCHFTVLRCMGTWLVDQGALDASPVASIKTPKLDAPKRDVVQDDEVRQLLAAAQRIHPPYRAALAHGLLSVLCYGGLRRQELLDLRVDDILLGDGAIVVREGKGRKRRVVYPHADCMAAIRRWLVFRPADCKHDYLFVHDKGRRVHQMGIVSIMRQVKACAGLSESDNIHPHSIRRNCATRIMRCGGNIRDIQAFLGHANLETTAIYLSTDEEQLRKISTLGGLGEGQTTPAKGETPKPTLADFQRRRRTATR